MDVPFFYFILKKICPIYIYFYLFPIYDCPVFLVNIKH